MLADLGAEVIRVERACPGEAEPPPTDPLLRDRRSVTFDFRKPEAVEALQRLVEHSDIRFGGYRPGVTERLGTGPDHGPARNARLVSGRITGWGQDGSMARAADHDIIYIALSGDLHLIGSPGSKPIPSLNLIGDFGGGGLMLAFGPLAAYIEARRSGTGQIVDVSMLEGAVALLGNFFGPRAMGQFVGRTGENSLGGRTPRYDCYRSSDDEYVAIGAVESQFFASLLEKIGLDGAGWASLGFPALDEHARKAWPEQRAALAEAFASRTREEWCDILEGTDACFAPVLESGTGRHASSQRANWNLNLRRWGRAECACSAIQPHRPEGGTAATAGRCPYPGCSAGDRVLGAGDRESARSRGLGLRMRHPSLERIAVSSRSTS
jgi:alpha-methylacyl-CoA racemase